MIQRIQTIFLLFAFGLLASLFFVPMSENAGVATAYSESVVLSALLATSTAVSLLTVFLYRRRMLQIRLSIFNIVVLTGFQGLIAYYFFTKAGDAVFSSTAVFPIVAAILTFLALRYIARDEAMVRTADRLRK